MAPNLLTAGILSFLLQKLGKNYKDILAYLVFNISMIFISNDQN